MRRAAKVDTNHAEIVKGLREIGATVVSLAAVGKSVPDLLVGYGGRNWLLEVKEPLDSLSKEQFDWQASWRGQVATVRSLSEALRAVKFG